MSTHNMFSWRNKKNINTFALKKSALTGAMIIITQNLVRSHANGESAAMPMVEV